MDKNGNLLLAGDATQNSTTDIVAYRGTVTAGFGAQELLEQRTSAATFEAVAVGLNGQAIVTWTQSNGTALTHFAANITTSTGTWSSSELEQNPNTGSFPTLNLAVTDGGDGIFSDYTNGSCKSYFFRLTNGAWSAKQQFPTGYPNCGVSVAPNRNGDVLILSDAGWTTYDATSNTLVRLNTSTAPSVYGTSGGSLGTSAAALSVSGIGALTVAVPYDTLPTVAQPAGDGRNSVINLWGLFLE